VPVCFCRFSSLLPVRSVLLASRIGLVDSKKVSMWLASCTFFFFDILYLFRFLLSYRIHFAFVSRQASAIGVIVFLPSFPEVYGS
jgi:hypothetical protein